MVANVIEASNNGGRRCGSNRNGSNDGVGRFALHKDDDDAMNDALCSGHPIWHATAEAKRDSGSMSLCTFLF